MNIFGISNKILGYLSDDSAIAQLCAVFHLDSAWLKQALTAIDAAPKFYLGEYTHCPSIKNNCKPVHEVLPFKTMVMEYVLVQPQSKKKTSHLVLFRQDEHGELNSIHFILEGEKIILYGIGNDYFNHESGVIAVRPFLLDTTDQLTSDDRSAMPPRWDMQLMGHLSDILECKNVSVADMRPNEAMNAKRIKKGKLPLYTYKVLNYRDNVQSMAGGKTKGRVLRLHLRRGHIRHHQTAGNVWVRSCVVGCKENGVLDKDYNVSQERKESRQARFEGSSKTSGAQGLKNDLRRAAE